MKSLLMLFGYTAYQAGCIAPMMWFFVLGCYRYGCGRMERMVKLMDREIIVK